MENCDDPFKLLLSTPYNYTVEMVFENYDILLNIPTARSINTGRLNLFMDYVNNNKPDWVFITTWGIDGLPATSILKYDGRIITYIVDSTRFSQTYGDIHSYEIKKIYTDTSTHENLVTTNYHAVTTITYTDRAKRDMIKIHFTEDILKDILLHPTKIDEYCENNYIVHGKKTAKIRVEFVDNNSLLIHWIEYNKVPFIVWCKNE